MGLLHDDLFDALANEQSRQILFALVEGSGSIDLDSPPDLLGDRQRTNVERRHVHLPTLVSYGFVEWEPGEHSVEEGPRFDEVEPLLRLLAANRELIPLAQV